MSFLPKQTRLLRCFDVLFLQPQTLNKKASFHSRSILHVHVHIDVYIYLYLTYLHMYRYMVQLCVYIYMYMYVYGWFPMFPLRVSISPFPHLRVRKFERPGSEGNSPGFNCRNITDMSKVFYWAISTQLQAFSMDQKFHPQKIKTYVFLVEIPMSNRWNFMTTRIDGNVHTSEIC